MVETEASVGKADVASLGCEVLDETVPVWLEERDSDAVSVIEAVDTEEDSVPDEAVLVAVCEGEVFNDEVSAGPDELVSEEVPVSVDEVLADSWVENVVSEDTEGGVVADTSADALEGTVEVIMLVSGIVELLTPLEIDISVEIDDTDWLG